MSYMSVLCCLCILYLCYGKSEDTLLCGQTVLDSTDMKTNTDDFLTSVRHFTLDPQLDLIPNITYQVVISSKVSSQQVDGFKVHISGTQNTLVSDCSGLITPIVVDWTPLSISSVCIHISVVILSNNRTYFTSTKLCKTNNCRQYIKANNHKVVIGSPNFPDNYLDDFNCSYVIYGNVPVYLQFQSFQLEESYGETCFDYVVVKKDNMWTGPFCGAYDKQMLNRLHFFSLNGFMELRFITDNKIVNKGYQAAIFTAPDCNLTFVNSSGTISSYEHIFLPRSNCFIRISVLYPLKIVANIYFLELGGDITECTKENSFIDFQSNTTNGTNFISRFCGNISRYEKSELQYESSSSDLYLYFHVKDLSEGQGFIIHYEGYLPCSNNTFTSSSGELTSSNYPNNYLNNEDCFYSINVTGTPQDWLQLMFTDVHTESKGDVFSEGNLCYSDFIEIHLDDSIRKICGKRDGRNEPLLFHSHNRFIVIRFVSNDRSTRTGFNAKWTIIQDENHRKSDIINSVQFWFEIIWKSSSWSQGREICIKNGGFLAKISDLETQTLIEEYLLQSINCSANLAFWVGGNDIDFENDFYWTDGSKMLYHNWFPGWTDHANKQPSDDGYSDEDCVELRRVFHKEDKGVAVLNSYFWNDRSCGTHNPFICQHYRDGVSTTIKPPLECDQNIVLSNTRRSVSVNSPNYSGNYSDLLDCVYSVTTQPQHRILIMFEDFALEYSDGCRYDNFTFSVDRSSKHSITRCGDWNKKIKLLRWISPTNKANFRFKSDNSVSSSGYKATISIVDDDRCHIADQNIRTWSYDSACYMVFSDPMPYLKGLAFCKSVNTSLVQNASNNFQLSDIMKSSNINITWISRKQSSTGELMCDTFGTGSQISSSPCSASLPVICHRILDAKGNTNRTFQTIKYPVGQIRIPNNDKKTYGNNVCAMYRLEAPQNLRISVIIENMNIEYQEHCLYDFIEISEIKSGKQRLCGNSSVVTFLSLQSTISLYFESDFSVTDLGALVTWKWVNSSACIEFNTSFIWNLNYPLPFDDQVNCCEVFSSPSNTRMLITAKDINIEDPSSLTLWEGYTKVWLSNTSVTSDVTYISTKNSLTICLHSMGLKRDHGFLLEYSFVDSLVIELRKTIHVGKQDTGFVQSYHYPNRAPAGHDQEVYIFADYGYSIQLHISAVLDIHKCKNVFLEVTEKNIDGANGDFKILQKWTCENRLNGSYRITSSLNNFNIRFHVGDYDGRVLNFKAQYSVIKDAEYLKKTAHVHKGFVDYCDNETCSNGGECVGDDQLSCQCQQNFTGLFCQTRWCDLDICHNGICYHTEQSYRCTCDENYWGKNCNLTKPECDILYCNGRGICTGDQRSSPACACRSEWHGSSCLVYEAGYDGSQIKLLKEPIWIGMIVILNLVFAFTSMYIVRRRCEKRFKCCREPKPVEPTDGGDECKCCSLPASSPSELSGRCSFQSSSPVSSPEMGTDKRESLYRRREGIESPIVNQENKLAAAKLYDSFKTEYQASNDHDSDGVVGGLVGGTLNFCPTPDMGNESDSVDEEKCGEEITMNIMNEQVNQPSQFMKSHCYPDIVVVNNTLMSTEDESYGIGSNNEITPEKSVATNRGKDEIVVGLSAEEKRKMFATNTKSEGHSFNTDKLFTEENAMYTIMKNLRSFETGQTCFSCFSKGIACPGHRLDKIDSLSKCYRCTSESEPQKRHRKHYSNNYSKPRPQSRAKHWSISTSSLCQSSDCERINNKRSVPKTKHRRRKSRHEREALRQNLHLPVPPIIKSSLRVSRSNDLEARKIHYNDTSEDIGVRCPKKRGEPILRRNSYHIVGNQSSNIFNPDDMLNDEQKTNYRQRTFPTSVLSIQSDTSTEYGSLNPLTLTLPFASDMDTGFSSSSKSIFSSPNRYKYENDEIPTKTIKDSAYQSNQTSVEVVNIEMSNMADEKAQQIKTMNTTFATDYSVSPGVKKKPLSRKELKVSRRLELAASKLRHFTNDSGVIDEQDDDEVSCDDLGVVSRGSSSSGKRQYDLSWRNFHHIPELSRDTSSEDIIPTLTGSSRQGLNTKSDIELTEFHV